MSESDFQTYQIVKKLLPGIDVVYSKLMKVGDVKKRDLLVKKITEKMNAGRSTDSNKVKNALRKILTNIGNPKTDGELPADTGSKFDYGFHNDTTGRLLCPYTLNWDDPIVRQGLKDGSIDAKSTEHPLLAYENCKYNKLDEDEEKGLFRNAATIKLAKVIFTSPSSINLDTSKSATRKGNAKLANITSMTPRTIAYAHCQLRYSLCTRASYTIVDGAFDLHKYYWLIVKAIEDDKDFKDNLISYWNARVFGCAGGTLTEGIQQEDIVDPTTKQPEDALSRLQAQRAAKKARLAALANGSGENALQDVTNDA